MQFSEHNITTILSIYTKQLQFMIDQNLWPYLKSTELFLTICLYEAES